MVNTGLNHILDLGVEAQVGISYYSSIHSRFSITGKFTKTDLVQCRSRLVLEFEKILSHAAIDITEAGESQSCWGFHADIYLGVIGRRQKTLCFVIIWSSENKLPLNRGGPSTEPWGTPHCSYVLMKELSVKKGRTIRDTKMNLWYQHITQDNLVWKQCHQLSLDRNEQWNYSVLTGSGFNRLCIMQKNLKNLPPVPASTLINL